MKNESIDYRAKIIEIINKISNQELLKRIYRLAEYLFIYAEKR